MQKSFVRSIPDLQTFHNFLEFSQNLTLLTEVLKRWDRIHNTSFSSYLKYKPIKLECFITPH
jgi:hypothetical protein